MTKIYIGTKVDMNDKRRGMVFAISKDGHDREDWTYFVDVEGERRVCSFDDFRVERYTEWDLPEIIAVLEHQKGLSEVVLTEEQVRLDKINYALRMHRAAL